MNTIYDHQLTHRTFNNCLKISHKTVNGKNKSQNMLNNNIIKTIIRLVIIKFSYKNKLYSLVLSFYYQYFNYGNTAIIWNN